MPPSVLSAFLVFTFITAFTPGPNNILALSVGSRCGLKGSAPVLAGICSGFFCVMLLCGVLVFSLSSLSEQFIEIMKYVGCLYIVWLTWKIATARQKEEENPNSATGFMTGFILQFVNEKIIVYGMTAYSGFILPYHKSVLTFLSGMCALTLVGSAGTVTWAFAGSVLQHFFRHHARLANIIMAVMLLGCVVPLLSGL